MLPTSAEDFHALRQEQQGYFERADDAGLNPAPNLLGVTDDGLIPTPPQALEPVEGFLHRDWMNLW